VKVLRIAAGIFFLGTFVALLVDAQEFVLPWIVWFAAAAALMAAVSPGARTVVFVLVILGAFIYIGAVVTEISGTGTAAAAAEGVSVESGETIYWGEGKCSTCHSLGDLGSAVRGPNHENVCGRARDQRVAERQAAGASHIQTATDYIVESIADPDAYLVEGFSAAMPRVYLPPISLSVDKITSVILYMQAQGCTPEVSAIELPREILNAAAAQAEGAAPFSLVLAGDPAAGGTLFTDPAGPAGCVQCHTVAGEGAEVGPELTDVAGTQTLEYVFESIMDPSAVIASGGYEPIQIQLADGTVISGVLRSEDDTTLSIVIKDGTVEMVNKADVQRELRYPDLPSLMPGNFGDLLTVQQVADIMAFLQESAGVLPVE